MEHVQDIPLFLLCCPGRTYFEKFFWVLNFDASLDILDNIIVDHAVLFSLQKKIFWSMTQSCTNYGLHEHREWLFHTAMFLLQIDLELIGKKLICFGV